MLDFNNCHVPSFYQCIPPKVSYGCTNLNVLKQVLYHPADKGEQLSLLSKIVLDFRVNPPLLHHLIRPCTMCERESKRKKKGVTHNGLVLGWQFLQLN